MSGDIGVAFIGAGMVSELHQAALARTAGLRLVGAYDIDRGGLTERATRWGVRAYDRMDELLDDAEHESGFFRRGGGGRRSPDIEPGGRRDQRQDHQVRVWGGALWGSGRSCGDGTW